MKYPRIPAKDDRRRKLLPDAIEEMKQLRRDGYTYQKLADTFGVCIATVYEHLNPDKYQATRAKKIKRQMWRYRTEPAYRAKVSRQAVEHKQYVKAVCSSIEADIVMRLNQKIEQTRKRYAKYRQKWKIQPQFI